MNVNTYHCIILFITTVGVTISISLPSQNEVQRSDLDGKGIVENVPNVSKRISKSNERERRNVDPNRITAKRNKKSKKIERKSLL